MHMYNDAMKRTTIVASEPLLIQLRLIARREQIPLAEVIRQGLEWRAAQRERRPHFIGAGISQEPPHDTGRRAGDIGYTPHPWR